MHCLAHSQSKALSEYQRRVSQLCTDPSHHQRQRGGHATARAWRQGEISATEIGISTKLWAGSQLPTTSSWDPGQLTSARRVAAWDQRKHTAYLRRSSRCKPRKPSCQDREVVKTHGPHGTVCSPMTWLPELLRPRKHIKHTPNQVCALEEYLKTWTWEAETWEVHETQGLLWTVPLQSNLEPEQCGPGKHMLLWAGENPVWSVHYKHSPHTPVIFVCSVSLSPQHNWTREPK